MSDSATPITGSAPLAVTAQDVAPRQKPSIYPPPFAAMMQGRQKRVLGDLFGLQNFGVNLTELAPGAMSALRHCHSRQDEFIYILEGQATLITDAGETLLDTGMCAGFAAGSGDGHQLVNRSSSVVRYLEVGDRSAGDAVVYPDNDLRADFVSGQWQFSHKDGTPY